MCKAVEREERRRGGDGSDSGSEEDPTVRLIVWSKVCSYVTNLCPGLTCGARLRIVIVIIVRLEFSVRLIIKAKTNPFMDYATAFACEMAQAAHNSSCQAL